MRTSIATMLLLVLMFAARVTTATDAAALVRGLESDNPQEQIRAIGALAQDATLKLDDERLAAALKKCAAGKDPEVTRLLAREIGGRFIWRAKEQDPRAIELECELARSEDRDTRSEAIYYGLSTVREQTDATISAMLAAGARAEDHDPNLHGRIAWGLKHTPAERIAPLCEPYWAGERADANPKAAWVIYKTYVEATGKEPPHPERFAAVKAKVDALVEARQRENRKLMPELSRELKEGDSSRRLAAMRRMYATPHLLTDVDDSMLEAFEAAAEDPEARVRSEVARMTGNRWVWGKPAGQQNPRAIALAMKLRTDPDPHVRHFAVYFGLSTVWEPNDDVLRALVDSGVTESDPNTTGRVTWALKRAPRERIEPLFAPYLADAADAKRAKAAVMLYISMFKQPPPGAEAVAADLLIAVPFAAPQGQRHDAAALLEQFRALVPEDAYTEVFIAGGNQGVAVAKGIAGRRRLIALLAKTPQLAGAQQRGDDFTFVTPEMLAALRKQYPTRHASPAGNAGGAVAKEDPRYPETFQELYDHLGRVYPAFRIKNIDWKKVGDELLPRAKDVKDDAAFGKLVLELVARLEDSHAAVQPGAAPIPTIEFPRYDPGFACLIDDRDLPVVYHVDKGSPANGAGVKVGMTVLSVNGKPAEEAIKAWMDRQRTFVGYSSERYLRYDAAKGFCRQMKQGEVVKLEMEDIAGAKHSFELPATLGIRYLPRLPVPIEGVDDAGSVEVKDLGEGIGYIYVRRIRADLPQGLDAALAKLGDVKGLIIDVRGNSGGGFDARAAVRNFNPDDTEEPNRPRYKGPIALLVDERCISAGEGWSSWFVATKRARLFGTATAGASSRKAPYTLSNGAYSVIVPVKAYTGSLDRPIERRGLEPDVPVRCSARDLAAGRDTVLETARQYLLQPGQ